MKKIELDNLLISEDFEELSEDCQFTIEAGCGYHTPWPNPYTDPEGYRDWWYQHMWQNTNRGYTGQWDWQWKH